MIQSSIGNGIPVSVSLNENLENEPVQATEIHQRQRIIIISLYAFLIAVCISFIAKFLVLLINLTTQLFFYGNFSFTAASPAGNALGWGVIFIPAIGGVIVGLMALYGSKAIRGHGIPEAMEQILTNQSKIKPTITYLKPLSSAIAIGAGGPFGAEGPIIATGGALGSTFGQLLKITANERKILLSAGATAGMSAIFGSPIAAIFLAVELLLFEFSPRSIIPVALACITGAAGHHFLFEAGEVFPFAQNLQTPSNTGLFFYSVIGIVIGILSVGITKIVYFIEDVFEKIPVHWMWWPAIGGLIVGVVGYFFPRTLGVGYENITNMLNTKLTLQVIFSLCFMKFISWAIALGSGTSGGTLAPLLTIGAAAGSLLGMGAQHLFPHVDINIGLSALVGMSAMFAGASRAFLTSIIFAVETTGQSNALLALLASCTGSYFVSFFLMENTIMTEKISRRGVKTPYAYEPDLLQTMLVNQVIDNSGFVVNEKNEIGEVRQWLEKQSEYRENYFVIVNDDGVFSGIVSASSLFSLQHDASQTIGTLIRRKSVTVGLNDTLKSAVEKMVNANVDVLPVVSADQQISAVLSYRNILSAYKIHMSKDSDSTNHISLKRQGLKILVKGQKLITIVKGIYSSDN